VSGEDEAQAEAPTASPLRVLSVEEHQELPIPAQVLLRDGRPDIHPELVGSDLLRVYLKGGDLVFQATGWVGLLHVNPALAIEVRPRVPIANLERIIALSGSGEVKVFERFTKSFGASPQRLPSILDALATGLIDAVDALGRDGLHYEYARRTYVGSFPRGRIDPARTALHRLRVGQSPQSVHHAWERTRDVAPNQYLRAAVGKLLATYEGVPNREGRRGFISRLRGAERVLEQARPMAASDIASQKADSLIARTPAFRQHYPAAIGVAELVLRDLGVELRSQSGRAKLPAILINMDDVFEGYVRTVLKEMPARFEVLDGNTNPPGGARMRHIANGSKVKATPATPDVVIRLAEGDRCVLVADVKYKPPPDFPARDDLNQAVTYAVAYRANKACIFYPQKGSASPTGVTPLGTIGDVSVFKYVVDLNSEDMVPAENQMVLDMVGICDLKSLTNTVA
jgi:5-methylcytosine-specific restriction enzyme subunit McrC